MADPSISNVDLSPDQPAPGEQALVSVAVQENSIVLNPSPGDQCTYSLFRSGMSVDIEVYIEGRLAGSENVCVPNYITKSGTATADIPVTMGSTTPTQEMVIVARGGGSGDEFDREVLTVDMASTGDPPTTVASLSVSDVIETGEPLMVDGEVCCVGLESCGSDQYTYLVDGSMRRQGEVFVPSGCEQVVSDELTFDSTGTVDIQLFLQNGTNAAASVQVVEPEEPPDDGDGDDPGDGEDPDRGSLLPVAAAGGAFLLLGNDEKENEPRDLPP